MALVSDRNRDPLVTVCDRSIDNELREVSLVQLLNICICRCSAQGNRVLLLKKLGLRLSLRIYRFCGDPTDQKFSSTGSLVTSTSVMDVCLRRNNYAPINFRPPTSA